MNAATATPSVRRPAPPAAPVQALPGPLLEVTIEGELLEDAQMRIEGGSQRPIITLSIAQRSQQDPVRAIEVFADGVESMAEAAAKASTLTAGRRVRVTGEGLRTVFERGQRYYRVALVHRVRLAGEGAT
jgi:hypothetical protein